MDLITNEVNSASFGATLLAHLTASFEQNMRQKPLPVAKGEGPHILQTPDNRLLYYAAHDINLLYVRNLLRYVSGAVVSSEWQVLRLIAGETLRDTGCSGILKDGTRTSQYLGVCSCLSSTPHPQKVVMRSNAALPSLET
jgi:hypothetical protein